VKHKWDDLSNRSSLRDTAPKPHFQRFDGRPGTHSSQTTKPKTRMSSAPSSALPIVSFRGRGFDMIRSVTPPKTTAVNRLKPINSFSSPPPYHHSQSLYSQPYCLPSTPPPRPYHDLYSPQVITTTGICYPYHGTTNWSSPGNGSPIAGTSFHQHMMNHNPSPLITQATPYLVQPMSGSSLDPTPDFLQSGPQPLNSQLSSLDDHVSRPKKICPQSGCEKELDKNLEELTESLANQFLLSTSPGAPLSPRYLQRSVTPNWPNSPLYLPRISSPNPPKSQSPNSGVCLPKSRSQDWLPPHCPVNPTEFKTHAFTTKGPGANPPPLKDDVMY